MTESMREPIAERPSFGEGYEAEASTPFDPAPWSSVAAKIDGSRNYWVCTTRDDGRPHATPVWGLWHDGGFVFSTSPKSVKARNLDRDPRCTIHLESGDDVVVIDGIAEPAPVELVGGVEFLDRYEAKYAFRPDSEDMVGSAWRVRPVSVLAWDERSFVESQTRYRFA
jgi:PPOX class probable F420-dependent enzyme